MLRRPAEALESCARALVVSAGHPAPIHVSSAGRATAFPTESDPLGIFPSVILDEQSIQFQPGDRLYLYTDGLIEDPASGGRTAGLEQLRAACERRHSLPIGEAVDAITEDLRPSSLPGADDLLLMAVEARA